MSKKILVIEDEKYLSEMYKMKFEQEGYQVVVAHNGEDGITLAKKEQPDLVLLDLVLPKMDGYQVLTKRRAEKSGIKNTKVYILSNLGQNGEINKGLKNGADGYLVKANLTPSQLADNVKKIFAGETVGVKKQTTIEKKKKILASLRGQGETAKDNEKSILLIEDEEDIITMYKLRLEKAGYRVKVAKNGLWGLKLAREKKFDIILMDIVMPAMDGCRAIKELKADNKTKDTPVIVLSNSAQEGDIEKTKECGAMGYLLKSKITPAKLVKEIEKAFK